MSGSSSARPATAQKCRAARSPASSGGQARKVSALSRAMTRQRQPRALVRKRAHQRKRIELAADRRIARDNRARRIATGSARWRWLSRHRRVPRRSTYRAARARGAEFVLRADSNIDSIHHDSMSPLPREGGRSGIPETILIFFFVCCLLDTPLSRGMKEVRGKGKNRATKKQKCEATMAVEALDPGAPTKVGGHHMTGSTDPARDSSLKDR